MPMATASVTFLFLTLWSDQMLLDHEPVFCFVFFFKFFELLSALLISEHPLNIGLFIHFLKSTYAMGSESRLVPLDTIKIPNVFIQNVRSDWGCGTWCQTGRGSQVTHLFHVQGLSTLLWVSVRAVSHHLGSNEVLSPAHCTVMWTRFPPSSCISNFTFLLSAVVSWHSNLC